MVDSFQQVTSICRLLSLNSHIKTIMLFFVFPVYWLTFLSIQKTFQISKKMLRGNFFTEPLLEVCVCACICGLSLMHVMLGPDRQSAGGGGGGAVSRPAGRQRAVQPATWRSCGLLLAGAHSSFATWNRRSQEIHSPTSLFFHLSPVSASHWLN